jgi:prevent-host-death family protein
MAMVTKISSREFNQDTSGAKRAAARGPVYITDRGRPAHVLLAYGDYERLLGSGHFLDRLGEPAGVEDIALVLPTSDELARPADFG